MKWEEFKKKKENELGEAILKNKVDEPIKRVLKIINKNKDWVTTSSCSGRIVLLSIKEGKKDADFYKKWHGKVKAEEVELAIIHYDPANLEKVCNCQSDDCHNTNLKKVCNCQSDDCHITNLKKVCNCQSDDCHNEKNLWFRVEPFILHIAARNVNSANEFLKLVRKGGVKRGGIQTITDKKAMIEIQGNGQMIIPVNYVEGQWNKIIELSNEMLDKNFKHLKKLEKILMG